MQNDQQTQRIAERVGSFITRSDRVAQTLGIRLEAIEPGSAKVSLTVRENMLNGLGICHGGIIFTLADIAFEYACNSRNVRTLAVTCSIDYSARAVEGDTLTARTEEKSLNGRTGIYDVTVTNQDGAIIAHFRGTSHGTSAHVQDDL
jgi:acyl-CoA thioesterase